MDEYADLRITEELLAKLGPQERAGLERAITVAQELGAVYRSESKKPRDDIYQPPPLNVRSGASAEQIRSATDAQYGKTTVQEPMLRQP